MEHSIVENYNLPIQWSVMLEVERSFNHQNQSPRWSLLLLESTAIKWLKYYTNKAISCFYSQCLITKSQPSTQQWLMFGTWQLFTHTSAAPWALLCATHPPLQNCSTWTVQVQITHKDLYICLPLWGESRQQQGHVAVGLLSWGVPLPLTLARLTPVGTLYGTYFL